MTMRFEVDGYVGPINEEVAVAYARRYFNPDVRITITSIGARPLDATTMSDSESRWLRGHCKVEGLVDLPLGHGPGTNGEQA